MSGIDAVSPVSSIQIASPVAARAKREGLQRAEKEVLRRETALRDSGDVTSTVYHYSVGPDGKRYITGATVTIRTGEESEEKTGTPRKRGTGKTASGHAPAEGQTEDASGGETAAAAARMKAVERDVVAHEAAHKAAGGQFAGPVSYSYATGPDGRRYITGGEVSITAPEGRTPEETVLIMEQVKRAALAPGSPSPQDLRVAAAASAAQMRARAEIARRDASRAYSGDMVHSPDPGEDGFLLTA